MTAAAVLPWLAFTVQASLACFGVVAHRQTTRLAGERSLEPILNGYDAVAQVVRHGQGDTSLTVHVVRLSGPLLFVSYQQNDRYVRHSVEHELSVALRKEALRSPLWIADSVGRVRHELQCPPEEDIADGVDGQFLPLRYVRSSYGVGAPLGLARRSSS